MDEPNPFIGDEMGHGAHMYPSHQQGTGSALVRAQNNLEQNQFKNPFPIGRKGASNDLITRSVHSPAK